MQLIYYYGGMVVPNSFVCIKKLKQFYDKAIYNNKPFVCEGINRSSNLLKQKQKMLFIPDLYFMGAPKNNSVILELVEYLKIRNKNPHFSSDNEFLGDSSNWCLEAINSGKMELIGGEIIGIKTEERKTILLEDLMEEDYLKLHNNAVGVYIPADEILNRPKYQWFAVMPSDQLMKTNMIITKYLMNAIIDTSSEYTKSNEIKSVVSI